ncbi:MAG: family transposase [Bradyrhizobium sp.]|nr:family transposase [Bradyrhizobium sp.]
MREAYTEQIDTAIGKVAEHRRPTTRRCDASHGNQRAFDWPLQIARATADKQLSADIIRRRAPWHSTQVVELATHEWVDWFNNRGLLALVGNIPAEAEAAFYANLEENRIAA